MFGVPTVVKPVVEFVYCAVRRYTCATCCSPALLGLYLSMWSPESPQSMDLAAVAVGGVCSVRLKFPVATVCVQPWPMQVVLVPASVMRVVTVACLVVLATMMLVLRCDVDAGRDGAASVEEVIADESAASRSAVY